MLCLYLVLADVFTGYWGGVGRRGEGSKGLQDCVSVHLHVCGCGGK